MRDITQNRLVFLMQILSFKKNCAIQGWYLLAHTQHHAGSCVPELQRRQLHPQSNDIHYTMMNSDPRESLLFQLKEIDEPDELEVVCLWENNKSLYF